MVLLPNSEIGRSPRMRKWEDGGRNDIMSLLRPLGPCPGFAIPPRGTADLPPTTPFPLLNQGGELIFLFSGCPSAVGHQRLL